MGAKVTRRSAVAEALPDVQIQHAGARQAAPSRLQLARWAQAALGKLAVGREISVLLVSPARSRQLNQRYRGKNAPTNVLSFPAPATRARPASSGGTARVTPLPAAALGDLVICPSVLRTEARVQQKTVRDHWAHLFVHGLLHLVGFDHERDDEAQRMERREIRILRGLGIANPYRSH
jgi:probable rRNA maturation factor